MSPTLLPPSVAGGARLSLLLFSTIWLSSPHPLIAARADTSCAFVPEGSPASLTCPPGQVISAISFATFGTYTNTSSCSGSLTPAPACPTTVTSIVARLCVGLTQCAVSCDCASLPSPCGCDSSSVSLNGTLLRLAFPGVPCNGVPKQLGILAACTPSLPPLAPAPEPTPAPSTLLLEWMPSPVLGLDNTSPLFAWAPPASSARLPPAAVQAAARVIVTSLPSGALVWDSGVVNGTARVLTPPAPLALQSDARYQWVVSVMNGTGQWSPPSAPARFSTGLLSPADWSGASWIGGWRPGTLLRKDFVVTSAETAYASVFVSACQYYLLYLDGVRVGARELDVAWTRFEYFRSYAAYELNATLLLPPGPHTIGLALGQGFCGQSGGNAGNHSTAALLRMALHFDNGSLAQPPIVTDETWSSGSGPVLSDSTYFGEQYNASMTQPGWAAPGFTPSPGAPPWLPAALINDPVVPPALTSQLMPAIERVATLAPVAIIPVAAPGQPRWTFDFGQEVAGRSLLSLAPALGVALGTNFTMKHTEVLSHPPFATYDGSAWMGNLFWSYPVDSYIASGAPGGESYEPSFTEHGFRFVELSVDPPLATPPTADMLTAVVLRTAARQQTTLTLGHPTLQSISNASLWTSAAALMGIPAGTAARGERTGWTGDAAFASESELVDFDTAAFFTQFLTQMQQLQCADATIPSCIPNTDPHRDGPPAPLPCSNEEGDPSWGTVFPTIAWGTWKYYSASMVRYYPSLLSYVAMLEGRINATGLASIFCQWGDWNPVVRTDCHITAAASYLHDLAHMAELAAALGHADDAATFTLRLAARRSQFHDAFWNPALGLYGAGTQAAQAVALWLGVAAAAGVDGNVSAWLGADMVAQGGTFGFIGVRYAYEALALNGQVEAALRTLLRTSYPGYGYELYNLYEPTTSLWESWDAPTHNQWLDESSRNHHYQASINTFLRKCVCGLDMPPGASGWSTVVVRPYAALPLAADVAAALPFARATVDAAVGLLDVAWSRQSRVAGSVVLNVTLPRGTAGMVSVPKSFGASTTCTEGSPAVVVWDNGTFVPGVPGVLSGVDDGQFVTFNVTSGAFTFVTGEGGKVEW